MTPDGGLYYVEPSASCPEVANAQGCPLSAPGWTAADGWCRDTVAPLVTHVGADSCYRGYGDEYGSQCCYDEAGCLIGDDEGSMAGTPDIVGPASGELIDGTCDWFSRPWQVFLHWLFDVALAGFDIPSQWAESCGCEA